MDPAHRADLRVAGPPGRAAAGSRPSLAAVEELDVELADVTKRFGPHLAVDRASMRLPRGATLGVIGPNGSGKTTTLRMIVRILTPDAGRVRVLGRDAARAAGPDDRVAYLPEERSLYKSMSVRDVLRFMARLKGYTPEPGEIDRRLDEIGLGGWGRRRGAGALERDDAEGPVPRHRPAPAAAGAARRGCSAAWTR